MRKKTWNFVKLVCSLYVLALAASGLKLLATDTKNYLRVRKSN